MIATASIFLPYVMACINIVVLSIYVVLNKKTRKLIFVNKNMKTILMFFAFILIVPLLYQNWIGLAVGALIILAIMLGLYMRSVMTPILFERVLKFICLLSVTGTSCAISEKFIIPMINDNYSTRRITAVFYHPNYFGTIIGTVLIICAYKLLTNEKQKKFYLVIALMNVISMYLCESMFAWVEVYVGVAVLLIILKKYRLLVLWAFAGVLASFLIFIVGINIIPRLSDVEVTTSLRLEIWKNALNQIKNSLFLGHGFMSFLYKSKDYLTPHAHSLYLEMVLNFGIVGSIILLRYLYEYYKSVIRICFKEKKTMITSLILAVTAATLVHGVADTTLLWVQTFPLFLIILSGLGGYEKNSGKPNS